MLVILILVISASDRQYLARKGETKISISDWTSYGWTSD